MKRLLHADGLRYLALGANAVEAGADDPTIFFEKSYGELRQLARRKLSAERANHTLQATGLVHEVFCRLQNRSGGIQWVNRDHFMAVAAEAMRRILVEHARQRLAVKRGGGRTCAPVSLDAFPVDLPLDPGDLLDVHNALDRLESEDKLAAEFVKLRIFAGFSHIDTARQLGLNRGKGDRIWAYAKARLFTLIADRDQKAQQTAVGQPAEGSVEDEYVTESSLNPSGFASSVGKAR